MVTEKEKFKLYSNEWVLSSSIIGLSNIRRTRFKVIKILWIISLLACLGICSKMIVDLVIKYLNFQVNISLKIQSSSFQDFPAITFCNLNSFDRSKSSSILQGIINENNLSDYSNPQIVKNLLKSKIAGGSLDKKLVGFTIDDMLLSCLFNDKPCDSQDFILFYDFDYVNCYTFNSGYDQNGTKIPIKKINEAGTDRSLKLELYLGLDRFNLTKFVTNNGVKIVVHNQSVTPIISSDGIDITTGFQNNIGITKSFRYGLPWPYSSCIKNTKSIDGHESFYYKAFFTSLNMTSYRQKTCLKLCLQDFILKKCQCLDGSLPNIYKNVTICQSLETIKCTIDARGEYYSKELVCEGCPIECDSIQYSTSLSYSRYPTNYYLNYIKNKTNILSKINEFYNEGNISKSALIANIFYDELDYSVIEQVPAVSFDYLISNIGGNLGLFIGVSVLSLFELVEYMLQIIIFTIKTSKLNKKSSINIKAKYLKNENSLSI
ncbi:unnamed protein product [Brachionus calyciflorus]|uniref:Uncharacterized protein n=1 Tax=Brachionus calyciflorus TaxID=104777 RepID=A0A813LZD6_9BILA|nr:unnamed protein product [Brachionus calyciflorus]